MSKVVDLELLKTKVESVIPLVPEFEKRASNLSKEYNIKVLSKASDTFWSFEKYRDYIFGVKVWGGGVIVAAAGTLAAYNLNLFGEEKATIVCSIFSAMTTLLFAGESIRAWRRGKENIRNYGTKNVNDAFYKFLKNADAEYNKLYSKLEEYF